MTRQYPYRAVLKTENVINSIVIVRDRDIRFRTIAITISAPPKMACSFHGSGSMTSGQSAMHAANASIPSTNDARDAVGLDCESDSLTRAALTVRRETVVLRFQRVLRAKVRHWLTVRRSDGNYFHSVLVYGQLGMPGQSAPACRVVAPVLSQTVYWVHS